MTEASRTGTTQVSKNDAERWFERYPQAHGFSYESEPDPLLVYMNMLKK